MQTRNASNAQTLFEGVHGYTPDISEHVNSEFNDLACATMIPDKNDTEKFGRWIGVPDHIGN